MQQRKNLAIFIGVLLLGLGLLLSGTFLESTIFPLGTIVGTRRRVVALDVSRVLLGLTGIYLIIRRPRITTIHLSAFLAVGMFSCFLGALGLQVVYRPPQVLSGWKTTVPLSERNQLGYRGRPIAYSPQDQVVVLLGDSQVEAAALDYDSIPERRLESHLGIQNVKMFSLGTGGYGQDQELLALQEYLKSYRADLVVLWETPGNDVWNNVFKTHMGNNNPKPTFWIDHSGELQGPDEGLLEPLGNSRIVIAALLERAFGLPWRDRSWERELPEPYVPLDHYDGPVRDEWQKRWDTNYANMRNENLDTEKSHMSVTLAPRSKRMQYGIDLTHALIRRTEEVVKAKGGKLIVFYADTHGFDSEEDETYVLNRKYYRVSKRQYEANLRDINKGFETEVIPVTIQNWRVSPEDGHLNNEATNQVMSALAERLRVKLGTTQQQTKTAHE